MTRKMIAGIYEDLVIRVGPKGHHEALQELCTRPIDFTERSMMGYVYVSPAGTRNTPQLQKWITRGLRLAG